MAAACRSCGAEIVWTHDASTGRRIPLDAASRELRYVQAGEDRWRLVATHVSHFATCPQAKQWRQGGPPPPRG